jgi:hypothetical protein
VVAIIKKKRKDKFIKAMGRRFGDALAKGNFQLAGKIAVGTMLHYTKPIEIFKVLRYAVFIYAESK